MILTKQCLIGQQGEVSRGFDMYLSGKRINPPQVTGSMTVPELVDQVFQAYNSARLREGCQLLTERIFREEVTVGMSLSGALTPAGLGSR